MRLQQWTYSKLIHPRSNALLSFRRGSLIRNNSTNLCTFEQRWGADSKLNVAANARIPLLGFWQDSYEFHSKVI